MIPFFYMVITKEIGIVEEKYPNLLLIKNTKGISRNVQILLDNVQKEVEQMIQKYPNDIKRLQGFLWGEKGPFLYPIYVTNKQVVSFQTDVIFQEKIKEVKQTHLNQKKLRVGKQIEEWIVRLEKESLSKEITDYFFDLYIKQKKNIEICQQFFYTYAKQSKKESFLYHIDKDLYERLNGIIEAMDNTFYLYTTTQTKDQLEKEITIKKTNHKAYQLISSFLEEEVIYEREEEILNRHGKTVWESAVEYIKRWETLKNKLSFESNPMLTETKKLFFHTRELEEVISMYFRILELEKVIYPGEHKTKRIENILQYCKDIVAIGFPQAIDTIREQHIQDLNFEKIKYFLERYEEELRYVNVSETKAIVEVYQNVLENMWKGKAKIPFEDELFRRYKMKKEEISNCLFYIARIGGVCTMEQLARIFKGKKTKKFRPEGYPGYRSLQKYEQTTIENVIRKLYAERFVKIERGTLRVSVTEKGKEAIKNGILESRKPIRELRWIEFECIVGERSYSKTEKDSYIMKQFKNERNDIYRSWLDAACDSLEVARYIFPWLKEHYQKNMDYIFDVYVETKPKQHVKQLLQDIQKNNAFSYK